MENLNSNIILDYPDKVWVKGTEFTVCVFAFIFYYNYIFRVTALDGRSETQCGLLIFLVLLFLGL